MFVFYTRFFVIFLMFGFRTVLMGKNDNQSPRNQIKSWIDNHINSLRKNCSNLLRNVTCEEVLHLDAKALRIEEHDFNILTRSNILQGQALFSNQNGGIKSEARNK